MQRREFLATASGIAAAAATSLHWPARGWADELPADVKINRVVGFHLTTQRSKVAGKNSRLDVHGDTGGDRMLRLFTNEGAQGIGACNARRNDAEKLLGASIAELFQPDARRMTGPLGEGTMPLWDLAGKLLNQPVYRLLGGENGRRIPVYDGSVYFADLLPQYADRWQDRFREEIDMGLAAGHRVFKIKIGRGAKWMPREEGDRRDVEVVRVCRAHGGDDVQLAVDANNGYDLAGAKRLMDQIGPMNIAFVEELFPEEVEPCLELKEYMAANGWKTLLADGETQGRLDVFEPLVAAKAVDVLQGDMKRFGIEGILEEAAMGRPQGIQVAPHNWGSLLGFYMQLHVGGAIDNFYRAEHDPLSTDVLTGEGYTIRDGSADVPERPGFGLEINRDRFADSIRPDFDLRA
ncbi:MAG: enolase C-terminal domain-like protein [Pirellulales bacterium]